MFPCNLLDGSLLTALMYSFFFDFAMKAQEAIRDEINAKIQYGVFAA